MIKIKEYSIETVFKAMDESYKNHNTTCYLPDGVSFRRGSQRLRLFHSSGIICVHCKLEANLFILETQNPNIKPHLNLYHVNPETNKQTLFTKDHIKPRSKGGASLMENYQTMCSPCNRRKGNTYTG